MLRWWYKSWAFVKPWEAKMVNCEWKPRTVTVRVGMSPALTPAAPAGSSSSPALAQGPPAWREVSECLPGAACLQNHQAF